MLWEQEDFDVTIRQGLKSHWNSSDTGHPIASEIAYRMRDVALLGIDFPKIMADFGLIINKERELIALKRPKGHNKRDLNHQRQIHLACE